MYKEAFDRDLQKKLLTIYQLRCSCGWQVGSQGTPDLSKETYIYIKRDLQKTPAKKTY